jgi:nitroimidazol reductase NimA-like FMN-containing flavoprotein (pyridoxamine 5'-phosphate oxidase superfamily)
VGLPEDGPPTILPVNYVVDDGWIVFRTDAGSKLDAAVTAARISFQVDGVDEFNRTGWSVLVRGRVEEVRDEEQLARLKELPLIPYAPGAKEHYVRMRPDELSGRQISVVGLPSDWWG